MVLLAIDFGTTNTVISYYDNNNVNIMNDSIYSSISTRIGYYNDNIYCGNYIPIECKEIISNFKTSIGSNKKWILNKCEYSDYDLLIIFFNHLYLLIKKNINNIDEINTVITVPSNFNDSQREIIKSAFNSVNINVIRILNEPSAAALAYGLDTINDEENIMVVDIGGGTMDFTVLEKFDTMFKIVDSCGLNDLGGNDFTKLIVDDILLIYFENLKYEDNNMQNINNIIWNNAQKMKEKLSYLDNYEIKIILNNKIIVYNLSRERFNKMAKNLIDKMINVLTSIMNKYKFDYIVMVGGTSKIKLIQDEIKKLTNKYIYVHPKLFSVVSFGGAIYNAIINNEYKKSNDIVLLDILPLSLGVELGDGTFSIIIPKNTPLPVKRTQRYTTTNPSNNTINVNVYQGERTIANKNFLIGSFLFDKVSIESLPIIDITFKVDIDSIINITIVDRKSGIDKNILIKDIPKKDINVINEIIENSIKLNEIDENEIFKLQTIYNIKNSIENIIINLSDNLQNNLPKDDILKELNDIENNLESNNNLQLMEILNKLNNKYSLLINKTIDPANDSNNLDIDDIDDMYILAEKKELVKEKIMSILVKNPDWDEYLNPVLDKLTYNNVSIDYLMDKLKDLEELEKN
jgi:molecular chaperone DnaK (HSP70)